MEEYIHLTTEEMIGKVLNFIQTRNVSSETEGRNDHVTLMMGATTEGTSTMRSGDDHQVGGKGSWEKFYSLCIQYQSMTTKPLALILDPKTGLVSLVTKSIVSFIPRHELMNQVIICAEQDLSSITDDPQITSTLQTLLDMVSIVSRSLPHEAAHVFEQSLNQGLLASKTAQFILDKYLLEASVQLPDRPKETLKAIMSNIHKMPFLIEAIDALIRALNLESSDMLDISQTESSNTLDNFFTSSIGTALVSQNLRVFARIRFNFCRDLLLFQLFLTNLRDTQGFSSKSSEKLRAVNVQSTVHQVHSYHFLAWVSEAVFDSEGSSKRSPEVTEAQLNVLGLLEYVGINRRKPRESRANLLALFIERKAGILAKKVLAAKLMSSDGMMVHHVWKEVLPLYTVCVAQILWPLSNSCLLPEFLLGHNQLGLLEDYVKLCEPCVQYSGATREFFTGFIKVCRGQSMESIEHFNMAASGVSQELFLQKLTTVADCMDDQSIGSMYFNFYNKVIQLLDIASDPESVINVAIQAVNQLNEEFDDEHDEHLAQLYTTLFINNLEVGKYDEAYKVMTLNPDSSTRVDRLRQFIVKLFERNCIKKLVSYSFAGLSDDFVQIIETKARSNDLISEGSGYYEVLFSFHTQEGRHRRAASIMYEYGRRLGQELPGHESLRKQVHCYLITLNCLKLVEKKFQWIAKPTLVQKSSLNVTINECAPSPKRPFDVDTPVKKVKKEVHVLGIEDIKIEYELSNCRLKLLERDPRLNDLATSNLGPSDVVTLLLSNSMYETVLRLSRILKMSVIPVFESLVSKYIRLVQLPSLDQDADESMKEIYECFCDEMVALQDFMISSDCSPATKVWHLIQSYLETHEEPKSSKLHKCIAEKLLSSGVALPTSFKQSYQARNCPQYLWLLMSYNYVEEATTLAVEYLDAILGRGTEYFDVQDTLTPTSGPVYIPHNHLQNLLKILSEEENSRLSNVSHLFIHALNINYILFSIQPDNLTASEAIV